MPDYKAMYYQLAAKVADAVELLVSAQQQGERQFIEKNGHSEVILLSKKQKDVRSDEDED
ncbi:MAG: hypothetical protein A4E56_02811 [Pelotomaculum sp. PtaU1.Bin065]|nr:MAG: hypothetical protein A4E56_02811 [Pelotomaculum sp. PtaU1.Bin065]